MCLHGDYIHFCLPHIVDDSMLDSTEPVMGPLLTHTYQPHFHPKLSGFEVRIFVTTGRIFKKSVPNILTFDFQLYF